MNRSKQLVVLLIFLFVYAALIFVTVLVELDQFTAGQPMSPQLAAMPRWLLAAINAGIDFVIYTLVGLAGYWFARQLGLPGIYRPNATWRGWVAIPFVVGIVVGIVLVIGDRVLAVIGNWQGYTHPPFPLSLVASAGAGIGEEVLFRLFALGLVAFLLNLLLRRWHATRLALWIANVIAALWFAAGHLPSAMLLSGVSSPSALPAVVIVELVLLNGILGIAAGERYMRDGLVAAMGVHFWADVVWHVIFPLVAL